MQIKEYMGIVGKYRSHIMGFCILDVLIGHSGMVFRSGPLSYLISLLWVIDIFFFMTGMGAYHSLKKDERLLPFYKRRFSRIYPAYLPVIILYFIPIFVFYTNRENLLLRLQQFFGNLSLMGWINGMDNQFNWYIQALMIFYFAAPALFLLVRSYQGSGKKAALLLGFFCLTQISFIGSGLLVAYARVIAFVLGIIAADWADRAKSFRLNVPVMLVLWVLGNLLAYYCQSLPSEIGMHYGLSWYPGLLIIPGMMLILAWIFHFCSRYKALAWLNSFFSLLGEYSLEIYIVNVLIYDVLVRCGINIHNNLVWLAVAAVIGVLSIAYGKLVRSVMASLRAQKTA